VDGQTLSFGVFGAYRGAFVMHDRQTSTIWTHLTGEALAGPLAGRTLRQVPVNMTTLARWIELHPESLAPDPAVMVVPRPFRPGEVGIGKGFEATMPSRDHRLPDRTLVLGVKVAGAERAYVVDPDRPGPEFYQGELGEVPIVLLAPPGAWPLAFDRRVDGRVVDLRPASGSVVDATGTVWNHDGEAVEGPLAGRALAFLPSYITEWFAWSAYHPGTEIADPGQGEHERATGGP
jgi:Protein of unknown function (DUF3179)